MSQATHKRTAPFLTTTRTLSNIERLAQWQRRKQAQQDLRDDDQRYLLVWLIIGALLGLALAIGQFFLPCLVVWTSAGIHCL
jgi:hypothetical protein